MYRGKVVKYNQTCFENRIERTEFSIAIDDPSTTRQLQKN